jgi:hypothetical protein
MSDETHGPGVAILVRAVVRLRGAGGGVDGNRRGVGGAVTQEEVGMKRYEAILVLDRVMEECQRQVDYYTAKEAEGAKLAGYEMEIKERNVVNVAAIELAMQALTGEV